MNRAKVYSNGDKHYVIFSVDIGDIEDEAVENCIPVIQFIKEYNDIKKLQLLKKSSDTKDCILSAFGEKAEFRLFGLGVPPLF